MDPSFRIWGHELRSDSFLGLRLGWKQRDEEIVKRSSRHLLKAHTRKQKIIARSGAVAELQAATLGASEAKCREHDV